MCEEVTIPLPEHLPWSIFAEQPLQYPFLVFSPNPPYSFPPCSGDGEEMGVFKAFSIISVNSSCLERFPMRIEKASDILVVSIFASGFSVGVRDKLG